MKYKFKINDLVELKSGGNEMTVIKSFTKNTSSVVDYIKYRGNKNHNFLNEEMNFVSCSWKENEKVFVKEFEEQQLRFSANNQAPLF